MSTQFYTKASVLCKNLTRLQFILEVFVGEFEVPFTPVHPGVIVRSVGDYRQTTHQVLS